MIGGALTPIIATAQELRGRAEQSLETRIPDGGYPPTSPLGPLMAGLRARPRVAVRVDSYQATPYLVAGTNRIAVMQHRLARRLADRADLRVLECPGNPPPIVETPWWHEEKEPDEAHRWLRGIIEHAARQCDRPLTGVSLSA
jgi:DNA-binding transcriptional LysR family regulator